MIAKSPRAFDDLVAVAAFRAEQMSASAAGRELYAARVAKQFEPMAWHWPERAWDVTVYLLWSWHCRGTLRTATAPWPRLRKTNREQTTGVKTEKKQGKIRKKMFFYDFPRFFLFFSMFFGGFSMDFCKGRISPNILQISPKSAKILPLRIFSVLTPETRNKKNSKIIIFP